MKRILATFSGGMYHYTTKRIVEVSEKFGVSEPPWVYDDKWLKHVHPEFIRERQNLFDHRMASGHEKGYGWFCWKPYVIMDALKRMQDGDVVLFVDADTVPIADLSVLYDQCVKDGGFLFFNCVGQPHRWWCKRDAMHLMGQDDEHWRNQEHACARFMLLQKGARKQFVPTKFFPEGGTVTAEEILGDWLKYSSDIRINTFDKSKILPEYPDLHQPRCEQAVLTNILHRYGFKLYREACGFGNGSDADKELYGQLFKQDQIREYDPKRGGWFGSSFANIPKD